MKITDDRIRADAAFSIAKTDDYRSNAVPACCGQANQFTDLLSLIAETMVQAYLVERDIPDITTAQRTLFPIQAKMLKAIS